MKTISVGIITPSASLYKTDAYSVQIPLYDGLIGILPGHSPILALLGYGLLSLYDSKGTHCFVIDGGFLEITPQTVAVLAKRGEILNEVDIEQAKQDFEEAQAMMPRGEIEIEERLRKIAAARTRLKYAAQLERTADTSSMI